MWQTCKDIIFFPVRCLFPNNEYIGFLGVTPLSEERFRMVARHLSGSVLDIGCGDNRLIRRYRQQGGEGLGIDIAPNKEADQEVAGSDVLQFNDSSFDTVTILAALNHIPTREATLKEAYRCLRPGGKLVVTMLDPFIGTVGHKLWHLLKSDADMNHREEMEHGEKLGLSKKEMLKILTGAGFADVVHTRFSFGLNNLYVAHKR